MIATFQRWAATLPPEAKHVKPTVVHGAARGADVMAALLALPRGCIELAKNAGIPVFVCEGRLAMPVPRKGEQR